MKYSQYAPLMLPQVPASEVWDTSDVATLNRLAAEQRQLNKHVDVTNLFAALHERLDEVATSGGRELALAKTKLEEAAYYAHRAVQVHARAMGKG